MNIKLTFFSSILLTNPINRRLRLRQNQDPVVRRVVTVPPGRPSLV